MVEKSDYVLTEYQGGTSEFDSGQSYAGGGIAAGSLGVTTDPRSANLIKEVSTKLSSGVKQIELALVSPEVFDSIPKQHLKEVQQLSKLTGIGVSVHGPVVDPSGYSREGYSELNREATERRIVETLNRSHEINPTGNSPVVFHTSESISGTEWKTIPWKEKGVVGEAKQLMVVNREDGKMMGLKEETQFHMGGGKDIMTPEEGLISANKTSWDSSIREIEFSRESAERIMENIHSHFVDIDIARRTGKLNRDLSPEEHEKLMQIESAREYMKQANIKANSVFDKAKKFAIEDKDKESLKLLDNFSKQYGKELFIGEKDEGKQILAHFNPKIQSSAMFNLLGGLKNLQPRNYIPVEEFTTEQSSKTFGNAAFESYKKFGENAPLIAIENPPVGHALSTGEDLKNLVVESRKKFADKLIEEKSMDQKKAEQTAEKLIGATWDVGHINMLRKQGFDDKQIIAETEKVAPFVKHVHLSDNFGFEHTELPMGMGNVPMKEIMDKLGKKGFEAKKIVEAGQWWQHFQKDPTKESLEGLGSPMYSEGVGPYWSQSVGLQQDYFGGYGNMLPDINYQTFGAGFSQLPGELGGSRNPGGAGGRMSGHGME
jgi:sugar phosphate isomerase/epimerase